MVLDLLNLYLVPQLLLPIVQTKNKSLSTSKDLQGRRLHREMLELVLYKYLEKILLQPSRLLRNQQLRLIYLEKQKLIEFQTLMVLDLLNLYLVPQLLLLTVQTKNKFFLPLVELQDKHLHRQILEMLLYEYLEKIPLQSLHLQNNLLSEYLFLGKQESVSYQIGTDLAHYLPLMVQQNLSESILQIKRQILNSLDLHQNRSLMEIMMVSQTLNYLARLKFQSAHLLSSQLLKLIYLEQ